MHDTQNLHLDDVIRKRQRKKLHRYPLPKMADDIDNLLREAENVLNLDGSAEPQSNSDKKLHNEVNEMLGLEAKDEEEIPKAISDKQITSSVYSSSPYSKLATPTAANASGGEEKKKCHHLVLTGTYTAVGPANARKKSCDNMLCLNCDFKISSFDNYRWAFDADYLFLRNNFPDFDRLKSKLIQTNGCRAYACQCRQRSVNMILDVQNEKDLRWVCMKH